MTGAELSVDAQLRLTHDADRFDVWNEGDLLVCNAPSLSSLRDARAALEALSSRSIPSPPLLDRAPAIELRVRHAPIARVEPATRAAGVGPRDARRWSVRPRGVLAAAVRALG